MKRLASVLLVLALLLPLAAARSAACDGEIIDTGHFTLRAPKDWLIVNTQEEGMPCYYLYAQKLRSRSGGYIYAMEYDFSEYKYYVPIVFSEQQVCEAFNDRNP